MPRNRNMDLWDALDELAAAWLAEQPAGTRFDQVPISELMEWAWRRAQQPARAGGVDRAGVMQKVLAAWR